MTPTSSAVVVTGATGLLGSQLCRSLAAAGHEVRALSRTPLSGAGLTWHAYDMAGTPPEAALAGAAAVIHCAYETRALDPQAAYRTNVEGSARLFQASRSAGVGKIVFISSLSAYHGAVSAYGRSKLAVEGLLDADRDLVVRPGLILAPGGRGLYGRISTAIRRSRVVPLFYGGRQQVQTIAIDDLVEGVLRSLRPDITGIVSIAEARPVLLRELYEETARAAGVRPLFVPFPGGAALLLLRAAEAAGLRLPVTSENLLGLRQLRAFDIQADLDRLGLDPSPMRESVRALAR